MDPKVSGKLLTTHRRRYGVDVEALHGRFPLQPTKAPRWDLVDIEGYGGGNCVSVAPWMFSGYVGLYRRKKYIGGRLGCFLTCTPSPLDHVHSKNHAPEGFISFGLHLMFLFFEILK